MSKQGPTGKQRSTAQKKVDWKALEIVHADAAGIDVGGSEHWAAISPDRDPEPVRRFGCFTGRLAGDGPMGGGKGCAERGLTVNRRVLDACLRDS